MNNAVAYSVLCVYLAGLAIVALALLRRSGRLDTVLRENLRHLREEIHKKEEFLRELSRLAKGLALPADVSELDAQLNDLNEAVQTERGRITITETEREALDMRLRELESIQRQIDEGNRDVLSELDILRNEEREINAKTQALALRLKESSLKMNSLTDELSNYPSAVQRIAALKKELAEVEKRCLYFQEQIARVNAGYILLKKAYDVLDGEYALHYEKQQGPM